MKSSTLCRTWRLSLCLGLALSLGGCGTLDQLGLGAISHWFASTPTKSNLKGTRIPVLTEANELRPDPKLKSVPVVLPAPYVNHDWPEAGGYATNAMYHLMASGPLRVVWEHEAGKGSDSDSRLTAPPIVTGGRIFVLDSANHVYAFNATTGRRLWKRSVAPRGEQSLLSELSFGLIGSDSRVDPTKGYGGGLGSDNGKIFVSTGFGDVLALDPASGRTLWRAHIGTPFVNAPVGNGGRVFVSSVDNHLHVLNEKNGHELWDQEGISEHASILKSSSVAVANEYVIAPYTSGELFAIRVTNGHVAWSDTLSKLHSITALGEIDDIAAEPVVDRDMVFAISHSGLMAAIRLSTGERVWTKDITGIYTPWVAGEVLYVMTTRNQLLCLERKTGKVKWMHAFSRWEDPENHEGPIVWAGPVLVSNRLIVTSSDGHAESISPYSGHVLGRISIPDGEIISPIVANQMVYLYTRDAELVALR
ncbi:MAG: PQQ-binding-like beta-propeller repeat protein [Rhizomicrobium sp.]